MEAVAREILLRRFSPTSPHQQHRPPLCQTEVIL